MLGHRALTVEDYTTILKKRGWILVIPAVLLAIVGLSIAHFVPPQYISQTLTTNDATAFSNYENALAKNLPVLYQPNFTYSINEVGNGLQGVTPNSPLAFIYPEQWHY